MFGLAFFFLSGQRCQARAGSRAVAAFLHKAGCSADTEGKVGFGLVWLLIKRKILSFLDQCSL